MECQCREFFPPAGSEQCCPVRIRPSLSSPSASEGRSTAAIAPTDRRLLHETRERPLCKACIQPRVSDKTIRVSRENWRWLREQKREEESFDDVIARLRSQDKWSGFGALADAAIREGVERAHEQLDEELAESLGEEQ